MLGLCIKLAVLVFTTMLCICTTITNLHPLILVPGSGGNQLEARLTTGYKPLSLFCNRWYPISKDKEGWFRLWFDPSVLLAPFTKCFAHRMMLYYDPDLDDYRNAPGVESRVPAFGSTDSLLYLNPNLKKLTAYMAPLVDSLEEIGYVSGETLFGAPYDFRYGLAAEGHPSRVGTKFLEDLKHLIEKASASNGGKPVILLSHSLGALYVLQLLNRNSPSWRQRYIKHLVALSAPWGGTVQEMLTFASGSSFGVPLVDPLLVSGEQRSSESNLWLLPSPKLFGPENALVITPDEAYSALEIPQFLNDIGFPEGVIPYKSRILPLTVALQAPNVSITCIFGTGVKTPETLVYGEAGFDEQPEVVYGDGDGTVNLVSLLALESLWNIDENQPLKVIRISGISHTSILEDRAALEEIIAEISSINYVAQVKISSG
ncbi:Lecithin-cholesterol acyltransferase-like 1 [Hibiscus syriacus]|uniref:Lecithin-cholesterol acyltransferase-like 1 n=1 Tax=Hibiscus syriacus TaxID=106335 RepID=A0A6A2WFI1_HIBSY|nr:lecithin-cholesterol acyltransferase-like 1 [Hibiscus syriacus]KAE8657048.1 Lecithin-cholesterol acyltransferase-like 1 [Hibiscus syriacus]